MDDNTGTIAMSAELLCASVYMWNEGSHSSDVCWFRAKLEWGKGGQDYDPLGEFIKTFVHNVCI